jgi:F-type H+-transporting ATPase subunit b
MELVTPNLGTIFWMVIIFAIVAIVLKKFAWKPILNALYEREKSIESALNAAQEARQEMDKLKAGNEELLAQARKEKEDIMKEAIKLKENIVGEAKEKASAETQRSIEHARQQIQNEREKAVNEMKKQMTELSLMIAEKVIRKEMADDKKQQEMVRRLVDEIELN